MNLGYHISLNRKYGKKLIGEYDFPDLLCSEKDCEKYYNYCANNNMKFLKGTYGSIANKDFNKVFKISNNHEKYDQLSKNVKLLDHDNLIYNPQEKIYILTSSPYHSLYFNDFNTYNYKVLIFNPFFFDYHAFILDDRNQYPLTDINYGFTDATGDQLYDLSKMIREKTGVKFPFNLFKDNNMEV